MRIRNIVQKYTREGTSTGISVAGLYKYAPVGQIRSTAGQTNFLPDFVEASPVIIGVECSIQIVGTRTKAGYGSQTFNFLKTVAYDRVPMRVTPFVSTFLGAGFGFDSFPNRDASGAAPNTISCNLAPNPKHTAAQTLRRPRDPRFQRVQVLAVGTLSDLIEVGEKVGEFTDTGGIVTDINLLPGAVGGGLSAGFPNWGNFFKGSSYNITTIQPSTYLDYIDPNGSWFRSATPARYDLVADGGFTSEDFRAASWNYGSISTWPLTTNGFTWDTSTVESYENFSFITV